MKDQLTATLFGLVVIGTAVAAGAQPAPHHRHQPAVTATAGTQAASIDDREQPPQKHMLYGAP